MPQLLFWILGCIFRWTDRYFRGHLLDRMGTQFCQGLLLLGVDAQVAGDVIEIRDSPIQRIWIQEGDQTYRVVHEVPDHRITSTHRKVSIRAKKEKTFPVFGRLKALRWSGRDLGLEIIDRLNADDALCGRTVGVAQTVEPWLGGLGSVKISVNSDWGTWVINRAEGLQVPCKPEWECYEQIARHLLATPMKQSKNL